MDRGAVYDYMMYVIILNLTGRADRQRSPLDNQAAFHAYQYVREDWPTLEKTIKWDIEAEWEQNYPQLKGHNLNIRLDMSGRSFSKPTGVSQAMNNASEIWAKGIAQVNYEVDQPNWDEEELFQRGSADAFWWEGPDGSRILLWYAGWYIDLWTYEQAVDELPRRLTRMAQQRYPFDQVRFGCEGSA